MPEPATPAEQASITQALLHAALLLAYAFLACLLGWVFFADAEASPVVKQHLTTAASPTPTTRERAGCLARNERRNHMPNLTMETLDSGELIKKMSDAIEATGLDIFNRPNVGKPRVITVQLTITPKEDYNEISYTLKTALPPEPARKTVAFTGSDGKLTTNTSADRLMKQQSVLDFKKAASGDA
jgi:hypothetical protein